MPRIMRTPTHVHVTWAHIHAHICGCAGATGGVYVYMHVSQHGSGKCSVNHITYIVVYS